MPKVKLFLRNLAAFFFLLFLFSPASSLSGFLELGYFPNEKIAFLISLIVIFFEKEKIDYDLFKKAYGVCSIFLVCSLVHIYENREFRYDINLIYFFLALPFYVSYFKLGCKIIIKLLPYVVLLNIAFSIYQQVQTLENHHWVNYLNNYPSHLNYAYPPNGWGLFRTSGFFSESSQYATLLVLFVIFFLERIVVRNKINSTILFFSIIDIFISQSVTAFFIFWLYMLVNLFNRSFFQKNKEIFYLTIFLSIFILFTSNNLIKVFQTLVANNHDYPRLINATERMLEAFQSNIFFGIGLSWDRPSWDFLSIYFSGYGILGGLASLYFLYYFLSRLPFRLRYSYPVFLITNGHLLLTINIFMVLFALSKNNSNSQLR